MSTKQFHIFHEGHNLSSDQLVLIVEEINKRRRILRSAMGNLSRAMDCMETPREPMREVKHKPSHRSRMNTTSPVRTLKKTNAGDTQTSDQKALKGRVTYKVKGPDGRPMNIAEIKAKIDSIYDGKQGIVKQ